jgi:hypothetical protein
MNTINYVTRGASPYEFDNLVIFILDWSDGQQIPKRGPVFLIVEQPATKVCPIPHSISDLRYVTWVGIRSLQEPADKYNQKKFISCKTHL